MPFYCYGENSATFLIFHALSRDDKVRCLLRTLRAAGNGQKIDETLFSQGDVDVWLFPNFGKRHGFGEPDALVLVGDQSFWFEVESRIDLGSRSLSARSSIRQAARFHMLHRAITEGGKVRFQGQNHRAIIGPTASDSGRVKLGILRVKGHPVLRRIYDRLRHSTPHLVLMSVHEAKGPGGGIVFSEGLRQLVEAEFNSLDELLADWSQRSNYPGALPLMPAPETVWYTYWKGNASSKCYKDGDDPLSEGGPITTRPK